MTAVGNSVFFSAEDGKHGRELWKSDWSAAGTVMVKDINSRRHDSSPSALVRAGQKLFFAALTVPAGVELHTSDGTALGTRLVKNWTPGMFGGSGLAAHKDRDADRMVAIGDTVYFRGWDRATGHELWRSDGTRAGTLLVKDIQPGVTSSIPNGSTPGFFAVFGNQLLFNAWGPAYG